MLPTRVLIKSSLSSQRPVAAPAAIILMWQKKPVDIRARKSFFRWKLEGRAARRAKAPATRSRVSRQPVKSVRFGFARTIFQCLHNVSHGEGRLGLIFKAGEPGADFGCG